MKSQFIANQDNFLSEIIKNSKNFRIKANTIT